MQDAAVAQLTTVEGHGADAVYLDALGAPDFQLVMTAAKALAGSPGANEFSGASRYWRDEPGRTSQTRGTIGTSTRGRDTGDGQFYINLVDTPRLDHEYTIFAEVTSGMDVVDSILEGDVMQKIELVAAKKKK